MRKETRTINWLTWMLEEHAELTRRVANLREWWNELDQYGLPKFGEMGSRVDELRDLLAEHFADEEKDGYFAPVLAVSPNLDRQVNKLQEQHGQLLERLNDFANRLQMSKPPFDSWQKAYRELETILADLRKHEQAENGIVQSTFDNDVTAAD